MAKLLKLRRGTTTQHNTFTGAEGEVTVDTTKDTLVVHDGATAGGFALLRQDVNNLGTGAITSTHIADGTIVNGDINASAGIAHTKLASITAGSVLMGNASAVPTATALTGDVTINSSGVTAIGSSKVTSAMIVDGTIVNNDINSAAAIDKTKISGTAITAADAGTVTNAMLAGSIAASKISGTAITAADSGTVTSTMIADGTIVNGDISASAGIAISKLAASTISGIALGGNLNAVTFNNGGSGGGSGSTFNGSGALTVSFNTVGAPSTTGTNASGTWGISVTGSSGSCTGNSSTATALTTAGGSAPSYSARAWVNWDAASTSIPTARASGNISSLTDNGAGDTTINFATAMQDANFAAVQGNNIDIPSNYNWNLNLPYGQAPTSSSIRVFTGWSAFNDFRYAFVTIFR